MARVCELQVQAGVGIDKVVAASTPQQGVPAVDWGQGRLVLAAGPIKRLGNSEGGACKKQ